MRRELWVIIGLIAALAIARLLPLPQNGTIAGMPALCPFKNVTGLPCPGCGLTRSVVYAAHGQWQQAFTYHPFGLLFFAGLGLGLLAAVISLRYPLNIMNTRAASLARMALGIGLLVLWAVRLSGIWPYPSLI